MLFASLNIFLSGISASQPFQKVNRFSFEELNQVARWLASQAGVAFQEVD